jgi:glutamate dehydrogenase
MPKGKRSVGDFGPSQFIDRFRSDLRVAWAQADENLSWLAENLHPYFFVTMQDEGAALVNLAAGLHTLTAGKRLVLADEGKQLILATLDAPGSFYRSLRSYGRRDLSYAELTHSFRPVPGGERRIEIQRFEFDLKHSLRVDRRKGCRRTKKGDEVKRTLRRLYPKYDARDFDEDFHLLCLNNGHYVRISPPERTARVLWLYQQGKRFDGLYLDVEEAEDVTRRGDSRIVFAVANPPERDFLSQVMEVFHRMRVGVQRAYCLMIHTAEGPFFLGTFYAKRAGGHLPGKDSPLFRKLKSELYNTQIVSTTSRPYGRFVLRRIMTGEEASLTNAFISFCHTTLAHSQPDRYDISEVVSAFLSAESLARMFCRLFRIRFDPDRKSRRGFKSVLAKTEAAVESYNTGHRHLDELRRSIYRTAVLFIRHTLKTNFYVPEKNALAFRLDPAYLGELGEEFTSDLPAGEPFRVTFFSGRHGTGYHVGFADIARGGWRTVVCTSEDDYNQTAETLFREVYVLAHTQHLKNKDIYEGGSKMAVALDVSDVGDERHRQLRLHKLQFGFINAFFDVFSGAGGESCHTRVVDYYGEEEAIELGPDENMHDSMIERIARQAVKRRYLLGKGVISSKAVGINHKRYGVTSLGVVAFAEETMKELGIDIRKQSFSVKMTGGPSGDVAGNSLKFLLQRCPRMQVKLILDGSGILHDPRGIDRGELRRILFRGSIDAFRPEKIHPGGSLLSRRAVRRMGMKEMYRRQVRRSNGLTIQWVTADEMHRDFEETIFSVPADLFIPAGGRPETVDGRNWNRFFTEEGKPTCRAIVEGANSFLTAQARDGLQSKGVIIIRDASANKCGVISSSYEIIANLLMSDEEFLKHKESYVADVLKILEKRAVDEARHIFRRHRESEGELSFTEISDSLSSEINELYSRLFDFLRSRPELLSRPAYRRVLLAHLPRFVGRHDRFRRRISRLPMKYRCAMAASEIAAAVVYGGGWKKNFEESLTEYVTREFAAPAKARR